MKLASHADQKAVVKRGKRNAENVKAHEVKGDELDQCLLLFQGGCLSGASLDVQVEVVAHYWTN